MSWLNNSLNTIKGQLTTLAHEVLAETAGPGDEEYRAPAVDVDQKTALELLAETQRDKEQLDKLCGERESEIAILRKQITELQNNKISDSGGGNIAAGAGAASTAAASGRTSKTSSDNNATLEDSWCWEPDNAKHDNDHSSDTSSGNGNEMVNITLEEVPLGATAKTSNKRGQRAAPEQSSEWQKRIQQLEDENRQLNTALEELDSQHNLAIQNLLELKTGLQEKLNAITKDYESLKKEHAEKFINGELELGKIGKQFELLEKEHKTALGEKQTMQIKINDYAEELRKAVEEMADLQALLEKKNQDNVELIERVKSSGQEADKAEEERVKLLQKLEQSIKEIEELKQAKEKKTSESSTSSTGKHSEDEFIVVREGDANSSDPTTPPTKEELKDKIVQLENRVSELMLENGSLALKLQDCQMEKELSAQVLKENLQILQSKYEEQEVKLKANEELLEEQQERVNDLKAKAAEAIIAQEKLKALTEEKLTIEKEITKMKESLSKNTELEKRLIFSEQEKEALQLELQALRTAQERVTELESKTQKLTLENQTLKLNAEAETETLHNSADLNDKLKSLADENESLRAELESMAQTKFHQAIAEEKQEITDLDADDEEPISLEKLRELLSAYVGQNLSEGSDNAVEKAYKALRERLWKIGALEKNLAQMSEEILDLQDSKLVWDHEKKTLEADISQYILQCDELMKNNEILLNELENYKRNKLETIPENNEENILQLETQLEECANLNRTLEEEYAELNAKIEELESEKQELTEKLRATQQENMSLTTQKKDNQLQLETLELEKCNLLFELNELKSTEEQDNGAKVGELRSTKEKCANLESQLQRLNKDHADLVVYLQNQKAALMDANKELNIKLQLESCAKSMVENSLQSKEEEVRALIREKQKIDENIVDEHAAEIELLLQEKQKYEQKVVSDARVIEDLTGAIEQSSTKQTSLQAEVEKLRNEIYEETNQHRLEKETLEREYEELMDTYRDQTTEFKALQDVTQTPSTPSIDTDAVTRIAQLEAELLATMDLQKTVDSLNYEKNEIIKALQQKHTENMQYYMEIQRLQPIVQQLQQQQHELSTSAARPCEKCPSLESTIAAMQKEHEKLQDQIKFLREKSDILTTNLLTEQTNQRLVQQEKADVLEQNAAIRKDLERLREHLLEIEDMHTQETVEMQRELDETKAKMITLSEEVSKSSNAYTSASIRANQHAETLQTQYALVVQQRDELVAKLSLAEDRESKNQAALCNLQCALEQFQNDKENDITAATLRIRKDLEQELAKETQLQNDIAALNQQLIDANQGLRAASRLSDQLEACQQNIAALRDEVDLLKQEKTALEQKLNSSESSQTDKIDKSLIKSLLIGYVVSGNPNDKTQVLRMISSVLDFTAGESDKVGLNKQQQNSGWLGSILGGGGGGATQGANSKDDNLVLAFVQFLEQESQPKANPSNMPNLLNMTQSPAAASAAPNAPSRRTSSSGGAASAPMPILLNSNVLDEFAPTRNSSSILKDILSDS